MPWSVMIPDIAGKYPRGRLCIFLMVQVEGDSSLLPAAETLRIGALEWIVPEIMQKREFSQDPLSAFIPFKLTSYCLWLIK